MYIKNISGASNLMKYDQDYLIDKKNYFSDVTIIYEPKYDIESEIPRYLYHLSIQEFNNKILKFGLVPKSKNKLSKHLDRIYVCKDPNDCKNLINRMIIHYVHKYEDKLNLKWIIYKIDTDGLNLKLFKDPNYNDGYYLVDNIPPNNLSVFDNE
jgi:RNA:NAD 2'-phosphotransferase (TPT1/KptA family)